MVKKELKNFISALKEDELKEFRHFLQSKFFKITNRDRVIKLYDYLIKKVWPEFTDESLDNDLLNKKLKISNARNLKSNLIDALTEYFTYKNLKDQELHFELLELNAYRERGMLDEFKKIFQRYISKKQNLNYSSSVNNLFRFWMYKEQIEYDPNKSTEIYSDQVNNFLKYLDEFYMTYKIIFEIQNIRQKHRFGFGFTNTLVPQIVQEVEARKEDIDLLLFMYKNFHDFETTRGSLVLSKEKYEDLKAKFFSSLEMINIEDRHDILVMLSSMAIQRYRSECTYENHLEIYELYKIGVEYGIYLTGNDQFNPFVFKNIVGAARFHKDVDWLEKFIEENIKKTPKEFRNESSHYALACLSRARGDSDGAMVHLSKMDLNNFIYALSARILLSQIYYDNKEFMILDDYINSFSKYLTRQSKIAEGLKVEYNKYLKYLRKMVNFHLKRNADIISLLKDLENDTGIVSYLWLKQAATDIIATA